MSKSATRLVASLAALLLLIAEAAHAVPLTGNTAPGGFDVLDGTSDVLYHLDAASITVGNGAPVTSWDDSGSFGRSFTQGTASRQPTFSTSGINGLPSVNFDGATGTNGDRLTRAEVLQPRSVFVVNRPDSLGGLRGIWGSTNPGDNGIRSDTVTSWSNPGNGNDYTNPGGSTMHVNGTSGGGGIATGTAHILSATRGTAQNYTSNDLGSYFDGRAYDGLVAEYLVFDRQLNAAERQIIENHYSAKYNVALTAGNLYNGDTPGNGDFDNSVFGVANIGGTTVLNAGMDGFGIEVGSLGVGESILAGSLTSGLTDAWYVDSSNPGAIGATFGFDATGQSPQTDRYKLLFSSTLGGGFSDLGLTGSFSGNTLQFTVPAAQLLDGYFQLSIVVPEPSCVLLLGLGLLGLSQRRRRK